MLSCFLYFACLQTRLPQWLQTNRWSLHHWRDVWLHASEEARCSYEGWKERANCKGGVRSSIHMQENHNWTSSHDLRERQQASGKALHEGCWSWADCRTRCIQRSLGSRCNSMPQGNNARRRRKRMQESRICKAFFCLPSEHCRSRPEVRCIPPCQDCLPSWILLRERSPVCQDGLRCSHCWIQCEVQVHRQKLCSRQRASSRLIDFQDLRQLRILMVLMR